jgi:hypothetical protein
LPSGDRPPEAAVDWATLTTYVRAGGGLEHHYAFQASYWSQNLLPLQMPAGARLIAFQVDGVWSPRPPVVEESSDGPVIDLPAPARADVQKAESPHRYEVVYTTPAAPLGIWSRVEAPAPSPPVPPAAFRRLWRLAPEFSPLAGDRLRRRPGPGEGTPSAAPPLRPQDLFRAAPAASFVPWPWPMSWDESRRPEALPDVLLALRGKEAKTRPLGVVLSDAAAALRQKYAAFLVVDAAALHDAGADPVRGMTLQAASADDREPWDELGLAALELRGGWLVTTQRQRGAWNESASATAVPAPVEAAAAEAARWGRDSSGRFQAAAAWAAAPIEEKSPLPSPEMDLSAWTEWEPAAGIGDAPVIVVVRRPVFQAVGWLLIVPLGLAFLGAGRRWKGARLGLLLFWLASAGLGLLWLPAALQGLAWPALLVGCLFTVGWRVWSAARRGPSPTPSRSALAAAGSAVVLLLLTVVGRGGAGDSNPPAATTVYLVAGEDDAPEKTFVLAPPELLDQLRILARPGAGPAVVPVAAEYTGEVAGGAAEIDAVFQVVCFTDDAATVALPLDGVQLCSSPNNPGGGEVRVGGTAVKAAALPAPASGLAVPIRGGAAVGASPRLEQVEMHFRTPVVGAEEEREVQFSIPRLPQSRMVWRLPKGSAYVQAPVRHGAWNKVKDDPYTLDMDLGGLSAPLHIFWVPGGRSAQPIEAQVNEAYLWDLGADSSTLTALLSYSVSQGGTNSLSVQLPRELETLSVEVRRPRNGAPLHLRDWRVKDAWLQRTLVMEFPTLVSGEIEVALELAPRSPWPGSFVLPLPSPISPGAGRAARPKFSFLAYRTHGLSVERASTVGVTGITPEDFTPFWPAATKPDPRYLAYASTLSREDPGRPPVVGLKVRPAPSIDLARVNLEVRVGPAQADVRAAAVLTPAANGLPLVEWQTPPSFTVTEVAGPTVRRWSQEAGRVLVWLDSSAASPTGSNGARETKLELTGWLPLALGAETRLEGPNLRVLSAAAQETNVRLIPGDGVALSESGRPNLTLVERETAGGILGYAAGGREDYGGAWIVHAGRPRARVYTVVGTPGRRLAFVSVLDVEPAFGGVEALTVRVRDWAGNVEIKERKGVRQRPIRRGPEEWSWALEQDAGKPGPLRLVLTGEQSGIAGAGAVAPAVTVLGAAEVQQWAAVGGTDLTADAELGLAPAAAPPTDLSAAPAAAVALGLAAERAADPTAAMGDVALVWKATAPEWRLNLGPHDASSPTAPIEVFLAEHRAAADGGRWLHETVFWLRHAPNADLNLTLRADAEVLSAAIDGEETAPLQTEPRRLWLPLTGRPAVCRVRIRWRYLTEDLARPNLARPTLQGASESPGVWSVFVPPGWGPEKNEDKTDLHTGLAQAASLSWQRAEALFRISAALAQQAPEGEVAASLAEAQRRFYAECRRARQELEASPEGAAPGWPQGQAPIDLLKDLMERNKNLAKDRGFEAVRSGAEAAMISPDGAGSASETAAWLAEGRPLYAWAASSEPAPRVVLTPESGHESAVWAASAAWLGILLLIGFLSLWPSAAAWSRALWPEQIFLLGILGWWAAGGLTWIIASLLLLGVVGRMLTAIFAVGRLFRQPPVASSNNPGSA